MKEKVERLISRLEEVEGLLGDSAVVQDQKRYRSLTQEHAYLSSLREAWRVLERNKQQLSENQMLLKEERDPELIALLEEEIASLEEKIPSLQNKVEQLLVPPDPTDSANVIIELRAGTGGDEAALFVGDCVRMYKAFADRMGWRCEELATSPSEVGGYKEYIMSISGTNVFRLLKYEGGTHRVQRVPATESQGRVHTSAITVAILREPEKEADIVIDEKELRIDTYRASGAGGQHINTTDSAVRITHLPTGIVVYSQEERSQHKNKAKAMRFLKAKLAEKEREEREEKQASDRASQVGTGDRSERIRTYNFPQNRVTEHRINLTLYSLDRVLTGELEEICQALVAHFYQKKLAA